MTAYLQQGHGSWGLLQEPQLDSYGGLVLSPVNDGPDNVRAGLARLNESREGLEVILDPQLYNPNSDKGRLPAWSYFPSDFATADHSDRRWWAARGREVVEAARAIDANAVCSPALLPRQFNDDYYRLIVDVADDTHEHAQRRGLDTLISAIVPLRDLANPHRAQQIASILSSGDCDRIYLSFLAEDTEPRRPLDDAGALASAVHLVRQLSRGQRVHVAFCAHDLVLWKAAGATDVSSGKFFNLRRFTPARWRDEESGGRQVSYWTDGALLTYLKDQDVLRLDREGWFATRPSQGNPFDPQVLDILRAGQGDAWQKLSWLQYLWWVAYADRMYSNASRADQDLLAADAAWSEVIGRLNILFTDRFNDGSHVRSWINALREGLARR